MSNGSQFDLIESDCLPTTSIILTTYIYTVVPVIAQRLPRAIHKLAKTDVTV